MTVVGVPVGEVDEGERRPARPGLQIGGSRPPHHQSEAGGAHHRFDLRAVHQVGGQQSHGRAEGPAALAAPHARWAPHTSSPSSCDEAGARS